MGDKYVAVGNLLKVRIMIIIDASRIPLGNLEDSIRDLGLSKKTRIW